MVNGQLRSFYHEHCTFLPAMLGWFFFSAWLSTYNKLVFGEGHLAFPCPLLLTSLHFGIQWFVSHFACKFFPVRFGTERVTRMSWKEWARISIPCGLATALDVGLSNVSLVTITITFYTMVKSSTPIFVLFWAYIFGIERITWRLIGVMLVIALGEYLTVAGEVDFVLHGFLVCLGAAMTSGIRWTLVQLKLQSLDPPLKTTIVTMRLLAPSMLFGMLLISTIVERPWTKFDHLNGMQEVIQVFTLGTGGGLLAVCMVLCEFYLILKASAVILMIGGVVKEIVTIIIGVSFFDDQLNRMNIAGVMCVFLGVILYKIVFHLEKKEKADQMMHDRDTMEHVHGKLIGDGENVEDDDVGFGATIETTTKYSDDNDDSFGASRLVEMVDRISGKNSISHRRMEVRTDENGGTIDETEYVIPRQNII